MSNNEIINLNFESSSGKFKQINFNYFHFYLFTDLIVSNRIQFNLNLNEIPKL